MHDRSMNCSAHMQALAVLQPTVHAGVQLEVSVPRTLPPIMADGSRITQIIHNLGKLPSLPHSQQHRHLRSLWSCLLCGPPLQSSPGCWQKATAGAN